jgi:hypothetical protein
VSSSTPTSFLDEMHSRLQNNSSSPITRSHLKQSDLIPNRFLKKTIQNFCKDNNIVLEKHIEQIILGKLFYECCHYVLYEGELKGQKRHGQGKEYGHNGTIIYEGEWKENKMHGQGKRYDHGTITYEGEWKEDKMHGQGKMYHCGSDKVFYEGEWKEDKMHGQGKKYDKHGTIIYEGEWKKGNNNEEYDITVVTTI